ncbi:MULTISPECIES: hypothetical protein [unclassified Micromonospora]|uniref:hypothetical protein n=1 Tax=unclassified Micromonospora TaxID=2617518 RepID=UPI0033D069B8
MNVTLPGNWTAPRRQARTYEHDGREVYADTGRPVDERLGSHVVLWIVEDPNLWAKAIEVEGDTQLAAWPKRHRHIGVQRRDEAYVSAAKVRAAGTRRSIHTTCGTPSEAEALTADLYRSHPNPGVRYEVAAITGADACPDCRQPRIHADGQWRHHTGRWPVECTRRPEPRPEPELADGEFEIDPGTGAMTCGYCGLTERWAEAGVGNVRLTGFHLLGIEESTNALVVLAEATARYGKTVNLPHHCLNIPDDVHQRYAPTSTRAVAALPDNED